MNNKIKTITMASVFMLWSYLTIYSFGYGHKLVYCFTTLLILYGLIHISELVSKTFIILLTASAVLLNPAASRYGSPNINMVAAIKYTNAMEILDFLKSISFHDILLGILITATGILVLKHLSKINPRKQYAITAITISISIISYKPLFAGEADDYMDELGFPPIRAIFDIQKALDIISSNEESFNSHRLKASDFSPIIIKRKFNTYILVVGESVRRDYMGLYGYPVNNTPFLSTVKGTFFNNYVSSSFATVPSLTHSFILNNDGALQFNNNILRLAKLSGLHTYWLSNQGVFGIHDSPVAMIGKDADYSYFIKNGDSNDGAYYPDEALLPEYSRAIKKPGDKLIVLHLIGSHPDACSRTNGKYGVRLKSEEISCYVQSIKNTDALLKQAVNIAIKNGGPWSLIYFADHGLSHINNRNDLSHSDKYKENYAPPFVMISYDSDSAKEIDEIRSGLDFMGIFAQWIGVTDKHIKHSCDYFENVKCTTKATVLNGNLHSTDFNSLPSDPPET